MMRVLPVSGSGNASNTWVRNGALLSWLYGSLMPVKYDQRTSVPSLSQTVRGAGGGAEVMYVNVDGVWNGLYGSRYMLKKSSCGELGSLRPPGVWGTPL